MPRILMYGRMFRLETAHVARRIKRLYQGGGGARARVHVRKWNTGHVSQTEPPELKDFSYLLV